MGKAARNESIRLKATFYNNLGVGATLTGFIIPILAYARELIQRDGDFTLIELTVTGLGELAAASIAIMCRVRANSVISHVED